MSGRGETPGGQNEPDALDELDLSFGETLYTQAGAPVGSIRGLEEGGLYLTTREGVEALSIEHARSGHDFGIAELVWRCMGCGEMDHIGDQLPARCPNCDAPREDLMYWTED